MLFRELHFAMNNLTDIDEYQAKAVNARQELDLRTGAALTRFLTINFKPKLESIMKDKIISYGTCQFPTLGFVVEQYLKILNFKPENFWELELIVKKNREIVPFSWERGRLFDPLLTTIFYEKMVYDGQAKITRVLTAPTSQRYVSTAQCFN